MTREEIKLLQDKAIQMARRKGYPEDAEDFAQDVLLKSLESPGSRSTLEQMFVDYLRRNYGKRGTLGGDARIRARGSVDIIDEIECPKICQVSDLMNRDYSKVLSGDDLGIFYSYCLDGRSYQDIGLMLGVSKGRVWQKMEEIKEKISGALLFSDLYERMI